MTENTQDPTSTATTPDVPQSQEPVEKDTAPLSQDTSPDKAKNNQEAAKYRRQLRDTQSELETAQATIEGLRNTVLSAQLEKSGKGLKLEALTAAGHSWDSLSGEDGAIDPDKLTAAIDDTTARFGVVRQAAPIVTAQGKTPVRNANASVSWATAINPDNKAWRE